MIGMILGVVAYVALFGSGLLLVLWAVRR